MGLNFLKPEIQAVQQAKVIERYLPDLKNYWSECLIANISLPNDAEYNIMNIINKQYEILLNEG